MWEDIYKGAEDLLGLIGRVQEQTKATRKRRKDADYHDDVQMDTKDDMDMPRTPKKRRLNHAMTPSRDKTRTPQKLRTPQSKRYDDSLYRLSYAC